MNLVRMNSKYALPKGRSWQVAIVMLLALLVQISAATVAQASDEIVFSADGKVVKTIDLSTLKNALESHDIEMENPYYVEDKSILKRYRAFAIQDVLDLVFGESWKNSEGAIGLVAANGYEAKTTGQILSQKGGYLAYKDLDVEQGWQTLVSYGKEADPGPYFLVWTGEGQTYDAGFPWSWQVVEIGLVPSEK